jgi:hypothetical protein
MTFSYSESLFNLLKNPLNLRLLFFLLLPLEPEA